MASGIFDFNSDAPPDLTAQAAQVVVCKYDPDAAQDKRFQVIPNVRCEVIEEREGISHPQSARFHYVLDGTGKPDWPSQFEELFALIANTKKSGSKADAARNAARRKKYIVLPEDRIVVKVFQDAKNERDFSIYFDGFSEAPELHVSPSGQSVTFDASGVGIRLFDEPIHQRLERDASTPKTPGVETRFLIDGPTIFNPDGKKNSTFTNSDMTELETGVAWNGEYAEQVQNGDESEEDTSAGFFPIFLDPNARDEFGAASTWWTLSSAAMYLIGHYNDEEYVANPDLSVLHKLLSGRRQKDGADYFDSDDPSTYVDEEIELPEYDATGKHWPTALDELLGFSSFASKFEIGTDEDGEPDNVIDVYRKDGTGISDPKDVYFQQAFQNLDPSKTNTQEISITRDYKNSFNAVVVDTKPTQYEVSIVLAPGFAPATGDESASNRTQYLRSNFDVTASATTRDKYRLYVADESGEGHWEDENWETNPLDLSDVFEDDSSGNRTYCHRRRPGKDKLISTDSLGKPLRATLAISRDYANTTPAAWDRTGTWQPVTQGWQLLDDRLGIYITAENPEEWKTGTYTGPNGQEVSQTVRGVTSQANPSGANTRFYLRLTCVIEADKRPVAVVPRRKSSALKFDRIRYSHSKEAFAIRTITESSVNGDRGVTTTYGDTDAIKAFAAQVQQAHENPAIAGRVVIPHLDRSYQIGDAIRAVAGRDLALDTNAGKEQGESPRYPLVVARTFDFQNGQRTILSLSDFRADPR